MSNNKNNGDKKMNSNFDQVEAALETQKLYATTNYSETLKHFDYTEALRHITMHALSDGDHNEISAQLLLNLEGDDDLGLNIHELCRLTPRLLDRALTLINLRCRTGNKPSEYFNLKPNFWEEISYRLKTKMETA